MNAIIIDIFEVDNRADSFGGNIAESDKQNEDPGK
jgi:hypothetical protein